MRAFPPPPIPLALLALLAACGDKDDTGGPVGGEASRLEIRSPADGAFLDEGLDVELRAEALDAAGAVVEVDEIAWSTDDGWAAQGNAITVHDLPAGSYALHAQALVDGRTLDDSVEINVFAAQD